MSSEGTVIGNEEEYEAADLNSETWDDFERFFKKYNGVQDCCWCVYYHRTGVTPGKDHNEKCANNHDLKKSMVMSGESRAVLLYSGKDVILSCQYGRAEELPRIDSLWRYRGMQDISYDGALWRITCFFVDKSYRRRNLTAIALKEVLSRISREGGGTVEAYPIRSRKGFENWFGPLKTFEDEGFTIVREFGKSNVLARKFISGIVPRT